MKHHLFKLFFLLFSLLGCLFQSCKLHKVSPPPPPPIDRFANTYFWKVSSTLDTLVYGNLYSEKEKLDIAIYTFDTINNVLIGNNDTVYSKPNIKASFVGGEDSLKRFIKHNQNIKSNDLLSIFVSFIVDKNGKISKIGFMHRMAGYEYQKQVALDILNKMPDWIPAKVNSKNVASFVQLKMVLNDE